MGNSPALAKSPAALPAIKRTNSSWGKGKTGFNRDYRQFIRTNRPK